MEPDEAAALASMVRLLRRRFPYVAPEELDRLVEEAHRAYDGCPVRHFVPILVERDVVEAVESGHPLPQRTGLAS